MGGAHIVVRFPDTTEIHFLDEPPRRGRRIRSREGTEFVVSDVFQSGQSTYTVVCVRRAEFLREERRRPFALASDLVTLARRALPPQLDFSDEAVAGPGRSLSEKQRRS
jgi:hypothetical protein